MFNHPFDVNKLSEHGFYKSSINRSFADMLLMEIKRERFQEDVPDEPDYVGYEEKYYKDRYISTVDRVDQNKRSPLKTVIASVVIEYQEALIRYYTGGKDIRASNVTSYEGRKGYMMGWHQDIGDRSISETIIYLNDNEWLPEHGGEIEISEVERDGDGKVVARKTLEIIPPKHGDVVILENLSPHFEHRVLPWSGEHSRFSVIVIAGTLHSY